MTLHLDQISADFYAARGLDADCEWARTAYARLLLDGLDTDDAVVGLAAPLSSLRAAAVARDGSSPEHLLGTATEWAKQALPDLRASSDLRARLERPTVSENIIAWALVVVVLGIGLVLTRMYSMDWTTSLILVMTILLPTLIAVGIGAIVARRDGRARRGFRGALVDGVTTMLAVLGR